jgi:hypothetical protein
MLNDFIISHDFVQLVMKTIAIIRETRDPYFFLLTIVSGNCHIRLSDRESYLNDLAGALGFIGGAIEGGE